MPLAQQKHQVMLLCVKQGLPRGQSQNAEDTPKSLNTTPSASSSTCETHFFAFSSKKKIKKNSSKANVIWNDQNNVFHTVPSLGGRGEDKEVSHVVYCCTGKWLMVGKVTDEHKT